METEAKLAFKDKDSLYGFASSDGFLKFCTGASAPETVILGNSYLDTRDKDISNRGGMIRVRHYGGAGNDRYEFTVKYGNKVSGGLHQRYEWNVESDDGKFSVGEFKRLASDDPQDILSEVFGDIKDEDLMIICSNSFSRTVYDLTYGKSEIEACFDSGIIKSSDGLRSDEICELELEIKSGEIDDLKALTALIIDMTGCVPFEDTKYRRTLAMATGDQDAEKCL